MHFKRGSEGHSLPLPCMHRSMQDISQHLKQWPRFVLQAGFYWPTTFKDAHGFVSSCDACQRKGNFTKRNEMPQHFILEVEVFDVWGIYFMKKTIFSWKPIHPNGGRLCLKMGGSSCEPH
ncbi:putative mitochondrial protein (mitochondrion) [Arabidopsis thaliana]|uniref:Uncharacterized mitochondrial protein AtMg00750 n=3 Tax=Arabidopsis TaxID=3701 RepID=M750_ARATH|nr:RecName: Full=Uncharacterized mitochondrial protein AtMg00750; AltName: Full=ORF119 [Arabidopsis thaliana]KAG7528934.1 hypothetical protein ISN45_Un107g000050 [Arabidopsis thaliana x Arabidopsis arenosa]KAG7529205.1 hypothetical protein ISN44_Un144g000010 [Arabidopsis suecica]KAG7528955.1 hypothetical protein ISN45_Un107g000320 [Arabidopsis thaliana x Arabidopsis arenosa]KAG7531450.1 hypothetical protein ISN44_Un34g000080 [Arabidopsis suecica]CAA69820.1 unnamed protein product [Arabidopsis 